MDSSVVKHIHGKIYERNVLCSVCRSNLFRWWTGNKNTKARWFCRDCNNKANRAWKASNLEKHRQAVKEWAQNNTERRKNNERTWRKNNPEKSKAKGWRKKGINPECAFDLYSKHDGLCAICKTSNPGSNRGWNVDHCHETSVVRGLLCHSCNLGLGFYEKFIRTNLLDKFTRYLKQHKGAKAA